MKHSLMNWLARRIIALASPIVPRWRRRAWRETWDAELYHRKENTPVVRRSTGAISHAAWLRVRDWSQDGILQDVRYGIRSLAKQPGFTAVALLVLTLAIGANTTIFSLANGMLLRPLGGVESPQELVGVWRAREGQSPDVWSYPNYEDIRASTAAFSGAVTFATRSLTLRQDATLQTIPVQMVSRDFFEVLGVDMTRGHGLDADPQTANAVLSHSVWQRRFGGRPMIGETVELHGLPLQVVGIAAPGFLGLDRARLPEMWLPLDLEMMLGIREEPSLGERGWSWLRMVARLAPDTTLQQARAAAAITTDVLKEHAVNRDVSIMLVAHWSEYVPLGGGMGRRTIWVAPGDVDSNMNLGNTAVSPGYFRTVGIPLLRGRDFADSDALDSGAVMIVNEALAEHVWPGEQAVGNHLYLGSTPTEVVGVAATSKYFALTESPQPYFYTPLTQANGTRRTLLIRTTGAPAELIPQVRSEIVELPGTIAARRLATLPDIIASTYGSQGVFAKVIGMFGFLALVLAVVGAYGVTSYLVTRRTVEIGIRVAPGAQAGSVMRTVMRQTATLGVLGVALGVVLARAATPALAGLIEGVDPTDAPTFLFVAATLLASVALAGLIPARRAARVDPLIALRRE